MKVVTKVLILFYFLNGTSGLSLIGMKCGTENCRRFDYCSEFNNLCESCSKICDEINTSTKLKNNNYDVVKCEKYCQNYIHDKLYGKVGNNESQGELREEVRHLKYMVNVILVLIIITLLFIGIGLTVMIIRWKSKHNVTINWIREKLTSKKNTDKHIPAVCVTNSSGKPDLRLDMPPVQVITPGAGNTPSTATTTLSRRPTEDSTLDYAYDNPAMSSTPSPNSKPHESSL